MARAKSKSAGRSSDSSRTDGTTVFVRVEKTLKDQLISYSENEKIPQHRIIESLLMYFFESLPSSEERRELIEGHDLPGLGKLIESLAWAEHAFARKSWTWACEEYKNLGKLAANSPGIVRLSTFKQSFCLLDIASELRASAISMNEPAPMRSKLFAASCSVIKRSIKLSVQQLEPNYHRVVDYNIACGWSLLAQYTVESHFGDEMLSHLRECSENPNPLGIWDESIANWRQADMNTSQLEVEVGKSAAQSMKSLNEACRPREDKEYLTDHSFLITLAQSDPDLTFLRCDREFRTAFEGWQRTERTEDAILDAVRRLISP